MILTRKFIPYIYSLFFLAFSGEIFAQQLTLKITSDNKKEKSVLAKIDFTKIHSDEISIRKEVNAITEKLQWVGYFSNQTDSIVKKDSIYTSYFSLGKKIEKATITIPSGIREFTPYDNITLKIEELSDFLTSISNKLDEAGKSFSKVKLKNIQINSNKLFADVIINPSKKRTIDKIIVKGYEEFSKSHINHFLGLKIGSTFNQQKLKNASSAIQSLIFVSEIKPPEILFSKDSTIIYMYLKKNKVNNFDGLLNFASNENGDGLLFNGHIDLQLNNVLHTGEQFELLWKTNGKERQDFKISTKAPYIFNSILSPELSFNIYRQDSTFLNTKFYGGLRYTISPKTSIAFTYNSETSENTLKNKINNSIVSFNNSFFGLQFEYRTSANNNFFDNKFYLNLNYSFGIRNSNTLKENQFKIDFEASYLHQLNYRNAIFVRNKTGYLNSGTFLENEIYRIGGANSIRGFNEQSIFTTQFTYFNVEYRYLTSQTSYLYSITDIGHIETKSSDDKLLGIGIGYLFKINNTVTNIGLTINKSQNTNFKLQNSKFLFLLKSYF